MGAIAPAPGRTAAVQARTTAAFHRTLRPLAASAPRKPSRLLPTRKRAVTGASDPSCHTSGAHRGALGGTDRRRARGASAVLRRHTRPSARWEESHAATSRFTSAINRHDTAQDAPGAGASVVLATLFDSPLADEAIRFAVDAAVEQGTRLAVVNIPQMPAGGRGPLIDLGDPPDLAVSLRRATSAATAAGVSAASYRIRSLRPPAALVSLLRQEEPALVVLGPDVTRLSPVRGMTARRYRRTVRALRLRTSALIWSPNLDVLPAPKPRRCPRVRAVIASWPISRPGPW
jgi:hypothetical protein